MPKMSVTVPHRLGQAEALARIKTMLGDLTQRHANEITDLREEWQDATGQFSLKAMNMHVSGRIAVTDAAVTLDADLPLMATPFKGQIEQMVRERAEHLLT